MIDKGRKENRPSGPQGASHKLPSAPAWHHFPSRYADVGCTGLRDAHEENPESILDEHVQRVMRTPGCQSPGPGHRSPDSAHVPKIGVLGGAMPGHGKHAPKLGAKLDPAGLHLHRHGHHHGHHGAANTCPLASPHKRVIPHIYHIFVCVLWPFQGQTLCLVKTFAGGPRLRSLQEFIKTLLAHQKHICQASGHCP